MNRKLFTILLLVVFTLGQFSAVSATEMPGTGEITNIAEITNPLSVDMGWSVAGMAGPAQNVLLWGRETPAAAYMLADCKLIATIVGTSDAAGTFNYVFPAAQTDQDTWEFTLTVDDQLCATADLPNPAAVMANAIIDEMVPGGFIANPPSLDATTSIEDDSVACNTFEMWGLVSDTLYLPNPATDVYSGFDTWNLSVTGTFSPPPLGPDIDFLSWAYSFPATASGFWSFSAAPADMAGNVWSPANYFRKKVTITPAELADCTDFTDTAAHEDEIYIRYLATLGLIAGNPDSSFSPDSTLTRAEASALFEKANGYDETMLPASAPAGCEFTDVSVADWFAGWVWQACSDGIMNGLGNGLFGPADLLTRGQIVTIFNNIFFMGGSIPPVTGQYLSDSTVFHTVLNWWWTQTVFGNHLRKAKFIDVPIGAYYAIPVTHAYGVGVADATSENTFSPDQPILRGEFAKMLYRALSRTD